MNRVMTVHLGHIMISNLNQRAALQALTRVSDGGGGFSESWTSFASAWIALAPLSGGDVFGPERNESKARYRVTLRRRGDVSAGQRVIVGPRTFSITAVLDPGPQSQLMTLDAEELP
jgi:SPP1 family predicted phage head-tail adaptor